MVISQSFNRELLISFFVTKSFQIRWREKENGRMIAHSIENMGQVVLQILGVAEEKITDAQAFVAGLVVSAILLLTVTVLVNFL
jgi:hypothetical protein